MQQYLVVFALDTTARQTSLCLNTAVEFMGCSISGSKLGRAAYYELPMVPDLPWHSSDWPSSTGKSAHWVLQRLALAHWSGTSTDRGMVRFWSRSSCRGTNSYRITHGSRWCGHLSSEALTIAVQIPALVRIAREALETGRCCVIGLQSTGDARTLEVVEKKGGDDKLLDDFVSGPKVWPQLRLPLRL